MPFLPPNQQRQSTEGNDINNALSVNQIDNTDTTVTVSNKYIKYCQSIWAQLGDAENTAGMSQTTTNSLPIALDVVPSPYKRKPSLFLMSSLAVFQKF